MSPSPICREPGIAPQPTCRSSATSTAAPTAAWPRMSFSRGTVVLIPSIRNSANARFMHWIASAHEHATGIDTLATLPSFGCHWLLPRLARFQAREQTGFKRFKITEEDWRNRKKWDDYEHAVCDMIDRTSTQTAPWTLVEANNKRYARIKVLETVANALEKAVAKKR